MLLLKYSAPSIKQFISSLCIAHLKNLRSAQDQGRVTQPDIQKALTRDSSRLISHLLSNPPIDADTSVALYEHVYFSVDQIISITEPTGVAQQVRDVFPHQYKKVKLKCIKRLIFMSKLQLNLTILLGLHDPKLCLFITRPLVWAITYFIIPL